MEGWMVSGRAPVGCEDDYVNFVSDRAGETIVQSLEVVILSFGAYGILI